MRYGLALWGLGFAAPAAHAKLYETRDAALRRVFGVEARLEPRTVYLTPAQMEAVRRQGRARFDTPRLTWWEATRRDTLLGRAYLDTHPVRSLTETLLVVAAPDGSLGAIRILAFHEPEDYLPPASWLRTLLGRRLSEHLRPGDEVDGISGATLSARAATEAVRRVLALDRVLHGGKP
jgi:hypothetical protein